MHGVDGSSIAGKRIGPDLLLRFDDAFGRSIPRGGSNLTEAAVLAVGTVKGEVVVDEHEELVVAPMVRLTLSADHRILDGADAAEFLDSLKSYLEAPVTLIAGTCFDED